MAAFPIRSAADRRICRIEIDRISPNPYQPRRQFDEGELRSLADSIRRYGLLSPLLVRKMDGGYELIAGERRLRALQMLGCTHADAIVTSAFDRDCALLALIENLQREQLHFLDEAEACRSILREHNLTQEELAASLGKSPSALANLLRILRLSRNVRACIRSGSLSERHARCLLRIPEEDTQMQLLQRAVEGRLSVRQLEALVEEACAPRQASKASPAPRMKDNRLVINALKDAVRQLTRIGIAASSRVETHEDCYEFIVTVRTAAKAQ